jgi:predicted dienelactone hydrolase
VTGVLRRLRDAVVGELGRRCLVPAFAGGGCDRTRRDQRLAHRRAQTHRVILARCGAAFDGLGLATVGDGSTLTARIDAVIDRVIDRSRHFAQRVYPPNDLGPTADFGPFPVGIRTLALADPTRPAANGDGPRPVVTELYYPSTPAAVAGVERDLVTVLGLEITEIPAYRDVARAPGTFPLVVFSHGNNGIRIQSTFFATHLASHGFVVASPDHHGNTFVDTLVGITDPEPATNRPLDMSFLIDTLIAMSADPETVVGGAIDAQRIGASGHSFGGYTVFALAGGSSPFGTFTDTRVKAILPQAPASPFPDSFFAGITIPTLILGGSIDETTPFPTQQEHPFENLPAGLALVGLGEIIGGGHFTFSDFCEVPRDLLAFLGGFDEACEPRHLPWRHAHDIVNFLSLNFFNATLNADAEALARLAPEELAGIEDLVYRTR